MCGVDCGDFGHNKEEFKNILAAAESWIDSEVSRALKMPIKSTGMRPHFFFTLDKGTPERETNQATMVVFLTRATVLQYQLAPLLFTSQMKTTAKLLVEKQKNWLPMRYT